jgi:ATP-binding cassette, subfamily F, member 3
MLTVHFLSKSFDLQPLFEKISFSLSPGERTGLIGPNGCGKTTLLRILVGLEHPDSGHVSRAPDLRIGYLPQGFEPDPTLTFCEIIGRAAGNSQQLEEGLAAAAAELTRVPDDPYWQKQYDDLLRQVESAETGRAAAVLAGLGLDCINPHLSASKLSGGQKTRLSLALVLLNDPQLLLLDEPTNHLDIAMLEWLEEWLAGSDCAALIISHDRTFLDRTVKRILEMDPHHHGVREYTGNYSDYLTQRRAEIEKQEAAYQDQQQEIRRMQQDIARVKSQAAYTERQASSIRIGGGDMKIKGMKSYQQGIAKKVAKKAKSRERKLERFIEDEGRVERPQRSWQIKMEFNDTPHLGRSVININDLSVGYSQDSPLLRGLNLDVHSGRRIVLTGPNGSGKTTLLRTIAGQITPLGGQIRLGSSVRLGYLTQDQSNIDPQQTVLETALPYFRNQTAARKFLAAFLFTGDEPFKINSLLSYGQRARLMLGLLIADQCNCLLLDEPINHLDIPSRTQFEQALNQFDGAVLAVVHDRYFIERFADEVWWVENNAVRCEFMR